MLRIEILTIFPDLFRGFCDASLIRKAQDKGLLALQLTDIRDYAPPPHRRVDDAPYGGGAGMLFKPEPLVAAVEHAKTRLPGARVLLMTPSARLFRQPDAERLARYDELIIICGRYEGVDERVRQLVVDESFSIGDYVLMGGEVPAMAVIECIARLHDSVVGNSESLMQESFAPAPSGARLLEAPQYTRPPEFRGLGVPEVLLCGDPKKVGAWRHEQALARTRELRPELLREAAAAE